MKYLLVVALLLLSSADSIAIDDATAKALSDNDRAVSEVEKPVVEQLRAYNRRDIEAFLAAYSDDIRVYAYPNTLRYQGKDKMRERYSKYFESLDKLHCQIVSRMIQGNVVIDQERVTRTSGGQESVANAIAIYTVKDGKIVEVRLVPN